MFTIYNLEDLNVDDWVQNKSTGGLYEIVEINTDYVLLDLAMKEELIESKPKKVKLNSLKKSYQRLTKTEKDYYSQFKSIASLQKELAEMKEELWKTNSAYQAFMALYNKLEDKYHKLEDKYYKLKNESRNNNYNSYNSYTYNYNCNSFNINTSDDMTLELLKAGYKTLAKKYHPDRGGDTAKMTELNNLKDRYGF